MKPCDFFRAAAASVSSPPRAAVRVRFPRMFRGLLSHAGFRCFPFFRVAQKNCSPSNKRPALAACKILLTSYFQYAACSDFPSMLCRPAPASRRLFRGHSSQGLLSNSGRPRFFPVAFFQNVQQQLRFLHLDLRFSMRECASFARSARPVKQFSFERGLHSEK